ncbi:MAG: hypothetical protein R2752_10270 [Vicinamibacterales bacterium]
MSGSRHPSSPWKAVVCLLAFALAAGVAVLRAGPAQEMLDHSAFVIVLDGDDAPVTDLTPADVVIIEDGAPRPVTKIEVASEPISIGLLVDTAQPRMGSSAPTRDLRNGLTAFVKIIQEANPESRIAVMQTAGAAVMSVDFTNKTSDVNKALGRLFPSQRTSAVVMEALVDMGKAIAKEPHRRRAIVSIDFDSQETSGVTGEDLSEAIQNAVTSVWAVSIHGGSASAAREATLDAVTEITGGLRLTAVSASALTSQLETIARALTSQYLVTYQRPNGSSVTQVRAAANKGAKFLATRILSK